MAQDGFRAQSDRCILGSVTIYPRNVSASDAIDESVAAYESEYEEGC